MEVDERFEFDAPRYRNFDYCTESEGTQADDWFVTAPDGPGIRKNGQEAAPLADVNAGREPLKTIQEPAAGVKGIEKDDDTATSAGAPKNASNIRTSWGGRDGPNSNKRTFPHTAGKDAGEGRAGCGSKAQRVCVEQQAPRHGQPITRTAAGAGQTAAAEAAGMVTARGRGHEAGVLGGGRRAHAEPQTEPRVTRSMARAAMTPMPARGRRSPTSPKRRGAVTSVKPSKAAAATATALKRVLAPVISRPARCTKTLTLPMEFELATTARHLRSAGPVPPLEASPFKPLAEKVREFQNKTPARFKSRPRPSLATRGTVRKRAAPQQPHITEAKEPLLMTAARARPSRFKSRIEQEVEEIEKAHPFHARPVNPEVLHSSGQVGVPRVDKRPVTEAQPFVFKTERRATERKSHDHVQPQEQADAGMVGRSGALTRSQRLNRSILDGPVFQPHKDTHSLTVPKSPLLLTKLRQHESKQQEEPRYEFRARAVPNYAKSAFKHAPHAAPKELTKPQPFHLATEARGGQHSAQMAAQLAAQEAASRAARRMKAQPLPPTTDMPAVPPRPDPKPLTLPHPFQLESEVLHEEYQAHRQQELAAEEEARRQEAEFKARPMWQGKPYVVHDSEQPLTVPQDPHLATDARAPVRHMFDAAVEDKMRALEEEKARAEQERLAREEAEKREYRKTLKFQARPMPNFDEPYYTLPSSKPLTTAKTPNFASKQLPRRSCRNKD